MPDINMDMPAVDTSTIDAGLAAVAKNTAAAPADNNVPDGGEPFGFPPTECNPEAENQDAAVPEKYEFSLPEGIVMSPEMEAKFTGIAKEAGLTQVQADSLIKMHTDIVLDIQRNAEKVKNDWAEQCKKEGLSSNVNLIAAKLAVDTFGGGAAMNALVESGVAFNPAVQKMLQNIGHLLQEDNAPDGAHAGKEASAADLLFANSKY
ncbi:MAG: hypothetical protein PHR27_10880 [Candidatus Cloacimonetes bacterium]|nr:hypothetical protein [Candidatus Cloacimonadota bacterium]